MPPAACLTVRRRIAAGFVATALVAAGCTGGDDDPTPSTTVAPTTTTIAPRVSDGQLKVGAFLPLTGPGAAFGPPMIEALNEAIDVINREGGVLDQDVVLEQMDEGAGTIEDLLARDVDAIIGPASSTLALASLGPAVDPDTGVVTCSPMATALALDGYPDAGLFFRTAPSDSLQMETLAREAERTGAQSIAVGYLDDPYGRGLHGAFVDAIGDRLPVTSVGFSGDQDNLAPAAEELLADDPAVVVVLGDVDDGSRLLAALDDETDEDPPDVLVNDSLRQARAVIQGLSPEFRDRLTGYAPQSGTAVEGGPEGFFVSHAVDCLNLIALAAIDTDSDDPSVFRRSMSSVSSGGLPCTTFEVCASLIDQNEIDYNGYSGPVDLGTVSGDPVRAWFETFTFDEDGNEVPGAPIPTA